MGIKKQVSDWIGFETAFSKRNRCADKFSLSDCFRLRIRLKFIVCTQASWWKVQLRRVYSLWPWAGLTGSQRVRCTLSSHASRCIFPFLSSLQIAVCTMAVSAGFLGKEQSVQIWKATCEKTSNHLQLNSLCQSGCLHARLGQQGSTQCLNAFCQVLINCLGIFILNLFVYQTQLNLKVRDLDTEGFILALICPILGSSCSQSLLFSDVCNSSDPTEGHMSQ